ncbi:tyrosine protein phosphatase [Brevibacillus humidisoli]|uniref:tyrosine-protein phosphatase n=1 Tax=Brevibacillus humidisoli TaxID=2895522 RepID=UPI001E4897ED|nr:CpsB/CapC family capsule biosynthesis tyrosine phosphatase [Brevibacillus humidisoli]UFJ42497.1 tyrosine protein phosphatase [Brevibacillus humidisoli]
MIDLHSHILPGLDDGAQTDEEAIRMARQAVADGITQMVATPHSQDGMHENEPARIVAAVNRFARLLEQHGVGLRLHPGAEVHIHPDLADNVHQQRVLTIGDGGRFLLLELPVMQLPLYTENVLSQLAHRGITPIIAHPERCLAIQNDPDLLLRWISKFGVVTQVTAGSLIGSMGKRLQKKTVELVKHGLVHLVASDGHNCTGRQPVLSEAYQCVWRLFPQTAELFLQNAQMVLEGEIPLRALTATAHGGKRWFFFSRR